MNFKEQLVDSGRKLGEMVAKNVGRNPDYYLEILKLGLYEDIPMSSRAGRVLNICTHRDNRLFQQNLDLVFKVLEEKCILHRSILKIFAEENIQLNEEQEGILLNNCFSWIESKEQSVAVKIFSMDILSKFAQKEPDIIPELLSVVETQIPVGSKGVKHKAKKLIRQYQKHRLR